MPLKTAKHTAAFAISGGIVVMVVLFFGSFMLGQYPIDPIGVVNIIGSKIFGFDCTESDMAQTIVWKVRLPRICAALLVGASLAVAGAVYQGLFKNPMVSPDILGASSGAGLGAAIAILLSLPYAFIQVNAFVFGIVAVGLACRRARPGPDVWKPLRLVRRRCSARYGGTYRAVGGGRAHRAGYRSHIDARGAGRYALGSRRGARASRAHGTSGGAIA